jgi:hypothetical protein
VDTREVIDWLLEGDPAIVFQVHRDLLDAPVAADGGQDLAHDGASRSAEPLEHAASAARVALVERWQRGSEALDLKTPASLPRSDSRLPRHLPVLRRVSASTTAIDNAAVPAPAA